MFQKVILSISVLSMIMWTFHVEQEIRNLNKHTDICAQAIQQEQYQIDVITEWIKGEK